MISTTPRTNHAQRELGGGGGGGGPQRFPRGVRASARPEGRKTWQPESRGPRGSSRSLGRNPAGVNGARQTESRLPPGQDIPPAPNLGNYAAAEPLYRRSLAIREKVLGPEHPDVAASLSGLALLYQAQGNYAEAEPLYRRSLTIYEKVLGPEHPDVATSLANYAALLRKTGRADEAAAMDARAQAIRAKYE